MSSFKINEKSYQYFIHTYNNTGRNERIIEIPVAYEYISKANNLIEVGAVMPYYSQVTHKVYDPYDTHKICCRDDVFSVDMKDKDVLSISTLEHVGRTDYGNTNISETLCIELYEKIIKESKSYMITVPIGYNKILDNHIYGGSQDNIIYMKRINQQNEWVQTTLDNVRHVKYGIPYECANALIIAINL